MPEIKYGSRFLNTSQAAKYINLSPQTLHNFRHLRRGPDYIKAGKKVLYDIQDLDGYLESRKIKLSA